MGTRKLDFTYSRNAAHDIFMAIALAVASFKVLDRYTKAEVLQAFVPSPPGTKQT